MARFRFSGLIGLATLGITFLSATPAVGRAQWTRYPVPTAASFRGLSVVNPQDIWVSGTGGSYLWTDNGGTSWHVGAVPGAGSLDFRDVYAVSLDTVYLMAAMQDTARIYKTTDRGQHWTLQYDNASPGAFLDALAFWDPSHGLALGDPVNGHFTLLRTNDGGAHWNALPATTIPPSLPNEAAFAASGTALVTCGANDAWFATGLASAARVFITHDRGNHWTTVETPITAAGSSNGIFSLACADSLHGVAVGGDYRQPKANATGAAYTDDGGQTWHPVPPSVATGYLSGSAYVPNTNHQTLIAVGTHGTAVSTDAGHTWQQIDTVPLNTVMATPLANGKFIIWAVGDHGTVYSRKTLDK